ncbi:MAG TPA: DedA family protein [Methylomirabilota bacterium]|jgi:membrane protein DedA with SNARE-associated domain|nr:DedA family protein [Methylomirabilota bacterium]
MTDLPQFVGHWGYIAIFVVVVLGNVGLPLPEETILALAGYLVWRGDLRLSVVIAVGLVSAVVGDNIGYWLGRRFGRVALRRYASLVLGHPERLRAMEAFVARRGAFAVFVARFIPGIRFMAGPLAGGLGLRGTPFMVANVLGALVYVPVAVGAGYAVGYGFGEYVERLHRVAGQLEYLVLIVALVSALVLIGWRIVHGLRSRSGNAWRGRAP